MSATLTCPGCGHVNARDGAPAGKAIRCGGCGKPLAVAAAPAAAIRFACPSCGRKYATKPEFAGRKIPCTSCGAELSVPGGAGRQAVRAPASPLEELAAAEGGSRREHIESVLPSRSALLEQARQQAAEAQAQAVEDEPNADKPKKKKKKKKRKKSSGYFDPKDTLILIGGVGAFVAVLALIAWRFPDFRFPLGGLLCIIGFIVYLLGAAALRQLVAEEGAFKALLFRFFPPYQWWFVVSRWSDTRDYFAFFAAGLVILGVGGSVIKLSPIGKDAMKSEQEYQKARGGDHAEVPGVLPGQ